MNIISVIKIDLLFLGNSNQAQMDKFRSRLVFPYTGVKRYWNE